MTSKAKKDAAPAGDTVEGAPEPKPKRRLVFIAAAVLAVVGMGCGGYVFLAPQKDGGKDSAEQTVDKSSGKEAKSHDTPDGSDPKKYVVAPFKEIIVNITAVTARGQATSRFLKLNVALVYDPKAEGADRLPERQVFIRDSYIEFLRQLTEADLSGSAGLAQLKGELLHRARLLADTDAPQEILIADMVIQ